MKNKRFDHSSKKRIAYAVAIGLVEMIDNAVEKSHLRTVDGSIVTTLDQALVAIEQNRLLPIGIVMKS